MQFCKYSTAVTTCGVRTKLDFNSTLEGLLTVRKYSNTLVCVPVVFSIPLQISSMRTKIAIFSRRTSSFVSHQYYFRTFGKTCQSIVTIIPAAKVHLGVVIIGPVRKNSTAMVPVRIIFIIPVHISCVN